MIVQEFVALYEVEGPAGAALGLIDLISSMSTARRKRLHMSQVDPSVNSAVAQAVFPK